MLQVKGCPVCNKGVGDCKCKYPEDYQHLIDAEKQQQRIHDAERKVLEHAVGLCMGVDWNNGTHAKHHRIPLENAVRELKAARGES